MTDQLQRVEQVFHAAMDWRQSRGNGRITQTQLDELCDHDARLRAEVQSLLGHLEEAEEDNGELHSFLSPSELHGSHTVTLSRDAALEEWGGSAIGQRIGEFVLIGQLGAGGMGIVYVAEQQNPRRTVALKVIRRTLATPSMIARFQREAELMGRLSHPHITQIFAAGISDIQTADGGTARAPYIAMEWVKGLPILEYVNGRRSEPALIVQLIAQACDAIQHAHQRGVIHRDLKPANLLVADTDAGPQVKVLDFGVARAIESGLNEDWLTQLTGPGHLIGTPAYMSPEQVQGRCGEVDSRCDVYALGMILFQLLAGKHAIDLAQCSLPEAARRIVEQEPLKLSTVNRQFRGDLETIVCKAIEKDRARRYQSPADLARDLRHFLAKEPIEAKGDSLIYVLGKKAARSRHRLITVSLGLALLTLLAWHGVRQMTHPSTPNPNAANATISDTTLQAMMDELSLSRIEQGKLLIAEGDITAAEDLICANIIIGLIPPAFVTRSGNSTPIPAPCERCHPHPLSAELASMQTQALSPQPKPIMASSRSIKAQTNPRYSRPWPTSHHSN